jgi:hypothetical protein
MPAKNIPNHVRRQAAHWDDSLSSLAAELHALHHMVLA